MWKQGCIYRATKPGQWLAGLGGAEGQRAHIKWEIRDAKAADVAKALRACTLPNWSDWTLSDDGFGNGNVVGANFVTPGLGWVDAVKITLSENGSDVEGDCWSESCGIVPSVLPIVGPVLSMVLFWVPFKDHGQNMAHIRELAAWLKMKHGITVEETEVVKAGAATPLTKKIDSQRRNSLRKESIKDCK